MLSIDHLTQQQQQRRAFSILCFLANGYVWASREEPEAANRIPDSIAVPFLQISEVLGLSPVVCHASVVLWNWTRIDPRGPLELDNVRTLHLYSGSMDESWFYLVTAAVEIAAVPAIPAIVGAFEAVRRRDPEGLAKNLEKVFSNPGSPPSAPVDLGPPPFFSLSVSTR